MLTNGLFMVSLCLIVTVFLCVPACATKGGKGGPSFWAPSRWAALMNVHSYDALLVGLVLLGFVASLIASRTATWGWTLRATLIVLGALPAALWFVHVLQVDEVFRARAATETYSPNFRQVLLGYLPPMALAFVGLYRRASGVPGAQPVRAAEAASGYPRPIAADAPLEATAQPARAFDGRRLAGVALAVVTILVLLVLSRSHSGGYFLGPVGWGVAFLAMVAATALLAERSPVRNLLVSWALVGTVAIYFPGLFQRKLTMASAIPWGLLAALAVEGLVRSRERSSRNLVTTLSLILLGGSALQWTFRELWFASHDVASTARHPVYLGPDVQKIVAYLDARPGRHVVAAFPGYSQSADDGTGHVVPDAFDTPSLPDVAPFLSGLAGAYTVAGHWSETPDYGARAGESTRFLLGKPVGRVMPMDDAERRAFIARYGVEYAVVPRKDFTVAASSLGEVVVPGTQFELVRLSLGSPE